MPVDGELISVTGGRRKQLVVLRALGLGDFLTGVPALRGLRRTYPDHELVLAAPGWLMPLSSLTGCVDGFVATQPLHRPDITGPDIAVNLHGKGPQSHRCLIATSPTRLVAFQHPEVLGANGPVWRDDEHDVHRWCRLVNEYGCSADPTDLDLAVPNATLPARWVGVTVIHPGASSPARRWPVERWAAVAKREASRNKVMVTGSASEAPLAARVAALAELPAETVVAGKTDLASLAALVARARLVVSGDTGIAHLATAYGTPSVILFGPVAPTLWGPPEGRPQHRVLYTGRSGDPHAAEVDQGLLEIQIADVVTEIDSLELLDPQKGNGGHHQDGKGDVQDMRPALVYDETT